MFVARHGRSELTTTILDEGQVRDLVERMLKTTGRRIYLSSPHTQPSQQAQAEGHRAAVVAVTAYKMEPNSTWMHAADCSAGSRPHTLT